MISFSHISKQYGRQVLFVDASFQLNPGEKVGLVGPNGAGKTTLFRMIVGEETPDDGEVSLPRKLTIGYFRQDVEEMAGRTVLDEAIAGSGRLGDLHHELHDLQGAMADPDRADVLLMDEPTNHLDIESILWLEAFLKRLPGALLMTSHDREFMNRIVTKIAEIDGGEITVHTGNYDHYEREREIREQNREASYARQQAMLAKEQRFIDRFATHAAKAAQVQSRVKALDKIEKVELPKKRKRVKFDFRPPARSGEQVATLQAVKQAYGRRVVYDGL